MVSLANFWIKRAAPHMAGVSPEHSRFNEGLKAEALRKILRAGLLAGGAGAGIGLLAHLLGHQTVPTIGADEPDVDLPYPQLKEGSAALPLATTTIAGLTGAGIGAAHGAVKTPHDQVGGALYGGTNGLASGLGTGLGVLGGRAAGGALADRLGPGNSKAKIVAQLLGSLLGGAGGAELGHAAGAAAMHGLAGPPPWKGHRKKADWADAAVHATLPTPEGEPTPTMFSPRWFRGDSQSSVGAIPWVQPAAIGAGFAGLWGGNALVRHLLKKKHKAQLAQKVEAAKQEYEDAMMAQYDPERVHKLAAVPTNRLDQVYDVLEKRGDLNAILGHGAGSYLTLASLLAGLTGVGTYRYLKGRSKSKLLADALKQRALMRGLSNPPDVFLHPVAAHRRRHGGGLASAEAIDPTATVPV